MKALLSAKSRVLEYVHKYPAVVCFLGALIFIGLVVGISQYGNALVSDYGPNAIAFGTGYHQALTTTLVRYDAAHFTSLAQYGYRDLADYAFLPLLVLGIRLVAQTGVSFAWAGLLLSWGCLCAAAVLAYYWITFELRERSIKASPWIILGVWATFPTAFFFALPFTESLFILLTLCALLSYRKKLFWLAFICTALASATRYQGLILGVYFAADYYYSLPRNYKKLVPILGAAVGLGLYVLYLAIHLHSPFAFLHAEKQWNRLTGNPIKNLIDSFTPLTTWFLAVAIYGLVLIKRYLGKPYLIYSILFMAMPLASGRFDSFNRYILCLAPMFLAYGIWIADKKVSNVAKWAYLSSSAFLLSWSILLFSNGYFVA